MNVTDKIAVSRLFLDEQDAEEAFDDLERIGAAGVRIEPSQGFWLVTGTVDLDGFLEWKEKNDSR